MRTLRFVLVGLAVVVAGLARAEGVRPFAIHVVDEATGRGVPLVELKTTSNVRLYTDSAGYVAVDEPAWVGRKVFFHVASHGYEFPADGFGMRGKVAEVKEGGEETWKIRRVNIAERMYRITGEGIYRDSVVLGKPVPIAKPLVNGEVTGQDSAQVAVYRGKVWWLFGDTVRQRYPLGLFSTSGAVSELPGAGGLDPGKGVDLTYFVNKEGFSRAMVPPSGAELHWVDGAVVVKDDAGRERLLAINTRLKSMTDVLGRELVAINDETATFEVVKGWDAKSPMRLCGHPFRHAVDGLDYIYSGETYPNVRVRADWASVTDPGAYEAYAAGADGKWAWRKDVPAAEVDSPGRQGARGRRAGSPFRLEDAATKRPIAAHAGSVAWNAFLKKWVMIFVEQGGKSSFLGEVWYAEADEPEGPWVGARKIATHEKYSFYNPVHLPFFDQEGGRVIYFQGTYASTFSREGDLTPRYEYNQMMYRLDLGDERLRVGEGSVR